MILKLKAIFFIYFLSVLFSLSIAATRERVIVVQEKVIVEMSPTNNYHDQKPDHKKQIDKAILMLRSQTSTSLENLLNLNDKIALNRGRIAVEGDTLFFHRMVIDRNLIGIFTADLRNGIGEKPRYRMFFGYDSTYKNVKFFGVGENHGENFRSIPCPSNLQNYLQVINLDNRKRCLKKHPVGKTIIENDRNSGQGPSNSGSIPQNPNPPNGGSRPQVTMPTVYPWTFRHSGQGPSNPGSILQNPRPQNVDSRQWRSHDFPGGMA
ncbi:unnamed protein product, partial [Brachionus calyciflorus]